MRDDRVDRERVEQVAVLVEDHGLTITEAAKRVGVSRAWAYKLLEQQRAAEEARLAEETRALKLRYTTAVELAGQVPHGQRPLLLASVLWPGPLLEQASRLRVRTVDPDELWRGRRRCQSCGIPFAIGYTDGCARCADRVRSQRRRDEALARRARERDDALRREACEAN